MEEKMSMIAKVINWFKGKKIAKESYTFDSSEIDKNMRLSCSRIKSLNQEVSTK